LAQAKSLKEKEPDLQRTHTKANYDLMMLAAAIYSKPDDAELTAKVAAQKMICDATWKPVAANRTQHFNNLLDADADVYLSQKDVRQLQLAKGAVAAGIEVLLEAAGVGAADVAEVVIAGGFGLHVRPQSLVALGLVPPAWRDRITFAGNAAKAGGLLMLLDGARRTEAETLAGRVRTVPLATRPDFQDRFVRNLAFPTPTA